MSSGISGRKRSGVSLLILVICGVLLLFQDLPGQHSDQTVVFDTVKLNSGDVLVVNSRTYYIRMDTIFYLPETLNYKVRRYNYGNPDTLLQVVKNNDHNPEWIKQLLEAMFREDPYVTESFDNVASTDAFLPFAGKIIDNIHLVKLKPFGSSIRDTTVDAQDWYARAANYIHISTADRIVKKNLLFSAGDRVSPRILADNERILRNLPYFVEAQILIDPVDSLDNHVNVTVITKDVWSKAFGFSTTDLESGQINLWDRNIFGFGHELLNYIFWDGDKTNFIGYQGDYRIKNLAGSFVDLNLGYLGRYGNKSYKASLNREFFTYFTNYAGGVNFENSTGIEDIPLIDTVIPKQTYELNRYGLWMGRSFPLSQGRLFQDGLSLVLALKYEGETFSNRPLVTNSEFLHRFHTKHTYLGSIALTKQEFRKSNLIYSYGRTEDIPLGFILNLTAGWENNQYYTRPYGSVRFSHSVISPFGSYFNAGMHIGGFGRNQAIEQGVLNIYTNTFSKIIRLGAFQTRNFLRTDYTRGINRFGDEFISISNSNGITGLSSYQLRGTQKWTINLESVTFTPLYLYGFRFAYYFFADMGWVGFLDRPIFKSPFYSGYGLGVRFRNERLVFNTVQLRFVYYPKLPAGAGPEYIQFGGEPRLRPENFFVKEPDVIPYE